MPQLDLQSGALHYHMFGAGPRVPLVCLHGGGCRGSDFAAIAEQLGADRRVLAPDLRGHGASMACEGPYDIETCAQDVEALLHEHAIERVIVVGHSMGGPIALELLKRAQVEIAAVISIDAPLVLAEAMGQGIRMIVDAFDGPDGMGFYRQFMSQVVGWADDADRAATKLDDLCDVALPAIQGLVADVAQYDGTPTLAASQAPLLHVDAGLAVCDLDRLAAARPDAWIGKVVGTGHYPHMESPSQVVSMMRHFLARHPL